MRKKPSRKSKRDFRRKCAIWVEEHLGEEYVEEFLDKYDTLNKGGTIGGFYETAVFLDLISAINDDIKRGAV